MGPSRQVLSGEMACRGLEGRRDQSTQAIPGSRSGAMGPGAPDLRYRTPEPGP